MNPLKEARINKGWTLKQLSEKSGVPDDTINKLENDRRRANFLTLRKLAIALDIDWQSLSSLASDRKFKEPESPKVSAPALVAI